MHITLLFWLLPLLPGYVAARYIASDDLDSGLLGVLGVSLLLGFALLSPFSIVCYLLGAPLFVFSLAYCVLIIAGAAEVTRRRWWRDVGRLFARGLCLELLVVALDMTMGAVHGALIAGDAVVHLSRIRMLLDHGFNNYDPCVGSPHFFPIYHTNLLHAMFAACSQLTGVFHVKVWFASLPFAKLMAASGTYFLVWSLFQRRFVAWAATMLTVGIYGPISFLIYPNRLAPLWIFAILLGWSVRSAIRPDHKSLPWRLGAATLVLGQIHGLYAGFAVVCVVPILGSIAAIRSFRRDPARGRAWLCTLALFLGVVFPLVSYWRVAEDPAATTSPVDAPNSEMENSGGNHKTMSPRAGWGTLNWQFPILIGGIAIALRGSRRKPVGVLLGVCLIVVVLFYVPPVYRLAVDALGSRWILGRMGFVLRLGFISLGVASIIYWLEPVLRPWWSRSLVSMLSLAVGVLLISWNGSVYVWPTYWEQFVSSRPERHREIMRAETAVALCRQYIPRGSTVLTEPWRGMALTMVWNCRIVAPQRGTQGIPDIRSRKRDLRTMLAEDTPWPQRRALLRKYGITHFLPGSSSQQWALAHAQRVVPYGNGYYIFVLAAD